MIQNPGDLLTLVATIGLGVVLFLLAILLYHLIFVVMDFRKIMHRISDFSEQVEGMLTAPVALLSEVFEWLQERVWDTYFGEGGKKTKRNRKKRKKSGFEEREV
ncbi:MAG: hypothetical protein AAB853_02810 [Patescibacteria group bacterium]